MSYYLSFQIDETSPEPGEELEADTDPAEVNGNEAEGMLGKIICDYRILSKRIKR